MLTKWLPTSPQRGAKHSRSEGVRPSEIASRLGIGPASVYSVLVAQASDQGAAVMLPNPSAAQDFERTPSGTE